MLIGSNDGKEDGSPIEMYPSLYSYLHEPDSCYKTYRMMINIESIDSFIHYP